MCAARSERAVVWERGALPRERPFVVHDLRLDPPASGEGAGRREPDSASIYDSSVAELTLFLDDGGVMNDNALRAPEWQRLVGEFFAPRLGGEPAAWAEANWATFDAAIEHSAAELRAAADFIEGWEAYEYAWLSGMCDRVGVATPPRGEAAALAREASIFITQRVRSAFPGAVEVVTELSRDGYTLHTASNEVSWELDGYLTGVGVRDRFGTLFGPDLVGAMKPSPAHYERALAIAEVEPASALVIDDSAEHLAAARDVGARTVLVGAEPASASGQTIEALAELPGLLRALR